MVFIVHAFFADAFLRTPINGLVKDFDGGIGVFAILAVILFKLNDLLASKTNLTDFDVGSGPFGVDNSLAIAFFWLFPCGVVSTF